MTDTALLLTAAEVEGIIGRPYDNQRDAVMVMNAYGNITATGASPLHFWQAEWWSDGVRIYLSRDFGASTIRCAYVLFIGEQLSVSQLAASRRGQLMDITYPKLQSLAPGAYSVGDGSGSVLGDPSETPQVTGWIIVFSASTHRVSALLSLGQGGSPGVYVTSGVDADNWVKISQRLSVSQQPRVIVGSKVVNVVAGKNDQWVYVAPFLSHAELTEIIDTSFDPNVHGVSCWNADWTSSQVILVPWCRLGAASSVGIALTVPTGQTDREGDTLNVRVGYMITVPQLSVSQLPSRIVVGTGVWSASAGSEKLRLWTKDQFVEKFGVAFNNTFDCAVAMNGDMNAQLTAKVLGCWYQNGDVGVNLSGHSTGPIRVNYVIFLH